MEAPMTTIKLPNGDFAHKTIDGKTFAYNVSDRAECRRQYENARSHNRELAIAADKRASEALGRPHECTIRELRDGVYAPDPRPVGQQIREDGANIHKPAVRPANPYRELLLSRGHDKRWYEEMAKRADNLDRELAEKEAKALRESDPLYQRALTNAQANLRLAQQDFMVNQSTIDARKAALERLQNGGPIDEYWQETICLDAENHKIVAPTEPLAAEPVAQPTVDLVLPPIDLNVE